MSETLLIRADGSEAIGHGHIFRTLTLATELRRRGWRVIYTCRDLPGAPFSRIEDAGCEIAVLGAELDEDEDGRATAQIAEKRGCEWIAIDRYATTAESYPALADTGAKLLAIDDLCAHPFPVDVLLNQNTNAVTLPYRTRDDTVRLLGPRYALVRRAYREARPPRPRPARPVERVLVFMGGGDAEDATGKVLAALASHEARFAIDVVLGAAYRFGPQLDEAASSRPHEVTVHRNLPDLAQVMTRADVAICAGGSVTWELCCLGVPMLLAPIADNQAGIVTSMVELGAALSIGRPADLDVSTLSANLHAALASDSALSEMGSRAWGLADGRGVARIATALERHGAPTLPACSRTVALELRAANDDDALRLWEWANDPLVRAMSFDSAPIPLADHLTWFAAQLQAADRMLLLAEIGAQPVGLVRFAVHDDQAEIGVSIALPFRGRGLGTKLICSGVETLKQQVGVGRVIARVKTGNRASIRAFENGGFTNRGADVCRGQPCVRLVRELTQGQHVGRTNSSPNERKG